MHGMPGNREGGEVIALTRSSPNKPLQRAGTHKVLGCGRVNVVLESSPLRPRAELSACGR